MHKIKTSLENSALKGGESRSSGHLSLRVITGQKHRVRVRTAHGPEVPGRGALIKPALSTGQRCLAQDLAHVGVTN